MGDRARACARGRREDCCPVRRRARLALPFASYRSSWTTVWTDDTRHTQDGVDLAFFNSSTTHTSTSADDILDVFRRVRPRSTTPTANAVKRVLEPYMTVRRRLTRAPESGCSARKSPLTCFRIAATLQQSLEQWLSTGKAAGVPRPKPLNLIILTGALRSLLARPRCPPPPSPSLTRPPEGDADGAPDKGQSPEEVLVDVARRLDKGRFPPFQVRARGSSGAASPATTLTLWPRRPQVGCSFVQIGN